MAVRGSDKKRNKALIYTKRTFHIVVAIILLMILCTILVRSVIVGKTSDQVLTDEALVSMFSENPAEAIVVLGAGVYQDGSLSPILKNRMDKAIDLYQKGLAKRILCTGDHRLTEYDEVDHMAEYLLMHQIPDEVIDRDYQGFSTRDSMKHTAENFSLKKIILVTQQYHLYRSIYLGTHFDVVCFGSAAENAGTWTGQTFRTLRENIASLKDFLYCLVSD